MRCRHLLVFTSVILCITIACAPPSPQPGALQAFTSACEKANEGQLIAVEGYLRLPDAFSEASNIELRLFADLAFHGSPIGVNLRFGNGPNETEKISSSFLDQDLKVHLADGRIITFGTKVRVSGRVIYPLGPDDFQCQLENPYLEEAR